VTYRALRLGTALAIAVVVLASCGGNDGGKSAQPARTVTSTAPTTTTAEATTTTVAATPAGPVLSGFVAFGDFGGGRAQGAVADAMERWAATHRVDALATTGDNVYSKGAPSEFAAQLDAPYRRLRATRPFWVSLGNHDVADGHGDEQLRYLGLPPMPYEKSLPGVQLLFLDANHPDAKQASWLEDALSKPGPPFRVVLFHQPAWSCGPHGSTHEVDANWVPVFEKHRTALVLNGHDHDYERFTSPAGVTYVVTGGGGQKTYPLLPCSGTPQEEAKAQTNHFTGVEVTANTLTLTAVGIDGRVIDRAVVTR